MNRDASPMDRRQRTRLLARWAKAYASAVRSVDRLDLNTWFDLWHTLIDWRSRGNRHAEGRAEIARLTYALLQHAEQRFSARNAPIQIFASVCEDTGSNAVYVHSSNPHGTPFPREFPNVQWGVDAPIELNGIVDTTVHRIGRVHYTDETVHIIERKGLP